MCFFWSYKKNCQIYMGNKLSHKNYDSIFFLRKNTLCVFFFNECNFMENKIIENILKYQLLCLKFKLNYLILHLIMRHCE